MSFKSQTDYIHRGLGLAWSLGMMWADETDDFGKRCGDRGELQAKAARRLSELTDRSERLDVRGQICGNLRANSMTICRELP